MPYVERVTKAGNTIEIERYFTSRYKKKGISRGDKVKPTKEEQEKVNTRQAERKLRILINANYGYGDYHLVLDYIRRKGEPDRTPEQMRQDIDVFLRECRKEYRKAGLEFKYIHVMEIGKKGARHHHLVVNKIDTEILQRCWYKAYEGHNRVKVFPLDDSGNYAELASYLIKYTGTHKKGTDGALQGKNINFVSTINTNSNLKFKADFDLGDRITCKETKWGIQIDARITEVTETYQKGEETIEATFGDSLPTLVDQIRKVR